MKKFNTIRVYCANDNINIPNATISLINSKGKIIDKQCTNRCGYATLPIVYDDIYRIRAQVPFQYSPRGQNCWTFLSADKSYRCMYMFNDLYSIKKTGTLKIVLCDENYPEYHLNKGEISLWVGF